MLGSAADFAWARDLFGRDSKGQRRCVPVFGTGLNIQAATIAGYPDKDDWHELLVKVSREVLPAKESLDSLPHTHLALWESLLCRWAKANSNFPFQAENGLQNFVCKELRRQEAESKNFQLYRDIAEAGFRDILSLNFDRRIALSCVKQKFVSAPCPCPLGSHGETLFRHSLLQQKNSTTRIWYPHGDVKKAATLKLGVRKYGFYIAVIREYVEGLSGGWRYRLSNWKYLPDQERKASALHKLPSWVHLFFECPLVFIGCGLSMQEWPLWWLLRRRAEKGAAPAVFFAVGPSGVPPHLRNTREVRTIYFESHTQVWSKFLGWLS
jgi:hypothetical protein